MANFLGTKSETFFECKTCNFRCSKKGDWKRHVLSLKHERLKMANVLHHCIENETETVVDHNDVLQPDLDAQKTPKILHQSIKSDIDINSDRSVSTKITPEKNSVRPILHQSIISSKQKKQESTQSINKKTKKNTVTSILHHGIKCENCGKIYKHQSSLCKHKKKCFAVNTIIEKEKEKEPEIKELINRNNELMEKLIEVSGEKSTTNNFNLNVFLNETCKDALNISDFIASLQIHLSDLNYLKDSGYSEGLSSIIVNELKEIEVSKRPLHCCDSKRDVIYIKDKDVWEPDNQNNDRMKNAIQLVANKCVQNIKAWENDNPNYLESGTADNDNYNALIKNSIGSMEAKTKERELNKIVKNVTGQIHLNKDKIDSIKSK